MYGSGESRVKSITSLPFGGTYCARRFLRLLSCASSRERFWEVRYGLGVNGGMAAMMPCLSLKNECARDQVFGCLFVVRVDKRWQLLGSGTTLANYQSRGFLSVIQKETAAKKYSTNENLRRIGVEGGQRENNVSYEFVMPLS